MITQTLRHLITRLFLLCTLIPFAHGQSELTFESAEGRPATLVLGGVDRFQFREQSGFFSYQFVDNEMVETRLTDIVTDGEYVTLTHPNGEAKFTFQVVPYDNYVVIHLVETEGIGTGRDWGVKLYLKGNRHVGHFSMNGMADCTTYVNPYRYPMSSYVNCEWIYLWGEHYEGKKGSIVLFDGTLTGTALDAVLAEVWSEQSALGYMVKPGGQESWTEADVLAWVTAYAEEMNDMTSVQMEAASLEELYALTDEYVIAQGIKRVYLHTLTWRGEYWPNTASHVNVNTEVFPNGKEDLKAYAQYLREHGVTLRLHSVSYGIGLNDPERIVAGVDTRLASWATGTLDQAASATDTTLYFRPDEGETIAMNIGFTAHQGGILYNDYMRINDEIVHVGSFTRTDDALWVLEGCSRGHGGTTAAAHSATSEVAGVYLSYGVNYTPEYDLAEEDSLMDEMIQEYADFVNELQLGHLHFDGPEIHDINPWMQRDIFDRTYSYIEHPTTSSRVGQSIGAHFEQNFSATRDDPSYAYFPVEVGIRLESLTKPALATSMLDTHFHVMDGLLLGAGRLTLTVPQSGQGFNQEVVDAHGNIDGVLELFGYWQEVIPVIHANDIAYLGSLATLTGGHYRSEDVPVLGKNEAGQYTFTPHRIMGRTSGEDALYQIEQEWGSVPRFQSITAGTEMVLSNPNAAQVPQVVIRVVETSTTLVDPLITLNTTGTLAVTGDVQPGEYLKYEGGTTATVYDNNWNVLRTLPAVATAFETVTGENTVLTGSGAGATTSDLMVQYITLGTPYILEANNSL